MSNIVLPEAIHLLKELTAEYGNLTHKELNIVLASYRYGIHVAVDEMTATKNGLRSLRTAFGLKSDMEANLGEYSEDALSLILSELLKEKQ